MNKIKYFCLALSGLFVFLLTSCLYNQTPYPSVYYFYDWKEISFEEAKSLWASYDTSTKLHTSANLYRNYPRNNYLVLNCYVQGDSYENYELQILIGEVLDLTMIPAESNYNGSMKYYTCSEDLSLVKVVGGHAWWDSRIFRSGWMVECRKDTAYDHEYYLIDYLN